MFVLIGVVNQPNILFKSLKENEFDIIAISHDFEKLNNQKQALQFSVNIKNLWLKFGKAFGFYENVDFNKTHYLIFEYDKLPVSFSVFVNKFFLKYNKGD